MVGAAAFGALRTASAFEKGILARDVLSSGLRPVLAARFLVAAGAGAVLATAAVAVGVGGVAIVSAGDRSGLYYASIPDTRPELVPTAREVLQELKVEG